MKTSYTIVLVLVLIHNSRILCTPVPTATMEQLKTCIKNPLTSLDNCRKSCDSRAAVLEKFKCELACFMKFHESIEHCSTLE